MDNRLYFVLGDLLANIVCGMLVGLVAVLVVRHGWNMWMAMVLMMLVGMVMGLLLTFPFGHWFGAMEVMIPVMQTGMMAGMVVGMWQAMSPLSGGQGALLGALTGLIVINVVWVANIALRGVRPRQGPANGEAL
jgi:hypothetical protein